MNTVLCSLTHDDDIGYILEVDLEYPKALHASHSDYPLAPVSLEISNDMLSPLQKAKFPKEPPQLKVTLNLRDKSKYVLHYRNLKLYTEFGMACNKSSPRVAIQTSIMVEALYCL